MSGIQCYIIISGSDDTIQATANNVPGGFIHGGEDAQCSLDDYLLRYPGVNGNSLRHALNASCEGVAFASIYFEIRSQYLDEKYTTPILNSHEAIVQQLKRGPDLGSNPQSVVDKLAKDLWRAVVAIRGAFAAS